MPGKPTYRELERRLAFLEKEARDHQGCQDALLEREAQYRVILETAPDSITVTTKDEGRYLQVNNAFCQLSGYSRAEVLGRTYHDLNLFVDERDRKQIGDVIRKNGAVDHFEVQYRRKDGRILDTVFSARPIVYENEDCFIAVVTDVSAQKRHSRELKTSEQRFKDLAELLPAVVFEIDTENYITYTNQSCFDQFRYTEKEFEKTIKTLDLVSSEDRKRAYEYIKKSLIGVDMGLVEFNFRRKDGTTFPALTRSTTIEHEGTPVGLRGFIIDISALKEVEVEKDQRIHHLQEALARLQGPDGNITLCRKCKRISNETGRWIAIDAFIEAQLTAELLQGICPRCSETAYPKYYRT